MTRPCFLVIDREYSGSISTRKLVIETAKLNVLTAYDAMEAIETAKRFPAIDGVVVDAGMVAMECGTLVSTLKEIVPRMPVIAISSPMEGDCPGADHQLDSFDPERLLRLLHQLCPEAAERVEKRDEELHRREIKERQ